MKEKIIYITDEGIEKQMVPINSVIVSLEVYNELRDFEKALEQNYTIRLWPDAIKNQITYLTKDSAVKELAEKVKQLEIENAKQQDELKNAMFKMIELTKKAEGKS